MEEEAKKETERQKNGGEGVRRQCGDKRTSHRTLLQHVAMSKKSVGQTVEFPSTRWSSAPAQRCESRNKKKVARW
jgi:hypothetical protein